MSGELAVPRRVALLISMSCVVLTMVDASGWHLNISVFDIRRDLSVQ